MAGSNAEKIKTEAAAPDRPEALPRILTPFETWGFGMSGHIVWIISAPAVFQALGMASMYTWLPLCITAMLSCFQIRALALQYPDVAGGVPSYIYRLFPQWKLFSTYSAIGWFIGWVMAFTVYGIIIVEAIESIFAATGVNIAFLPLVFAFSIIGFVVGFSSPRALSILHLIFVVPTMFLLLFFSIFGLFWLALSPDSPGFWPSAWPAFEPANWLLATFLGTYNIITMETEAVFAADSTNPQRTLSFLPRSAMLVTPIFLGGSYVLARLGSLETNGSTFEILNSVNTQLFGINSGTLVTLVTVVLCCLLSSASGVAIAPRALFQLSRDGLLNKAFGHLNKNGVAVYSLLLCLAFTVVSVFLGGAEVIFFSAGLSYLLTYTILNYGIWFNRRGIGQKAFPKAALVIALFYTTLILGGGYLAGWPFLVAGFSLPLIPMLVSYLLDKLPSFRLLSWPNFKLLSSRNFVLNQIVTSIFVVGISVLGVCLAVVTVTQVDETKLFFAGVLSFLVLSFCSVAIASWTALPQLAVIERARVGLAEANKQLEHDIEAREKLEQSLQENLRLDQLTGLGNRLLLDETLRDFLLTGKTEGYALIFVDLDRFKLVNDSLGHEIGDKLLKEVAARLRDLVQGQGEIIRLGGDEFVVFVPAIKKTALRKLAQSIVRGFRRSFSIEGLELQTTTSVGVVLGSSRYTEASDLVRDADVAMYQSKLTGRNKYTLFTENMFQETVRVHQTEDMLRRAIRDNQVRIAYQPIMNLHTETVSGLEALVRIEQDGRLVLPGDFIEVAEDSGLIVPLTEVILEKVCRQQREWREQGLELYVAVNLSDKVLRQLDLVERVAELIRKYDLSVGALQIEILESAVMIDAQVVRRNLEELSQMGVMIAVDDFGTGYSNLSRLRELPITTLKIDRSFVVNMRERGLEIIQTIGQLAEVLGLRPLVEGIETEEELTMVRETRCDYGQGYYFQRPVGAEEIFDFVQRTNQ